MVRETGEDPANLAQGIGGASRPQRKVRSPLRSFAGIVQAADILAEALLKLIPPPRGGPHLAAQQVDVRTNLVARPAITIRRRGRERIDQRRRLGGATKGQQRLGLVDGEDVGVTRRPEPSMPCGAKTVLGNVGSAGELSDLEQCVALGYREKELCRAVCRGPGQGQRSVKHGEPVIDIPAKALIHGQPRQDGWN